MEEKLININVIIADRSYPMKIKPEEEELIRKTVKQINEKFKELKNSYDAKDDQDYMAMCVLTYAVEAAKVQGKLVIEDTGFVKKLSQLDTILNDFLNK